MDATPFLPDERSLEAARAAAQECRGCPLWEPATQAVFGEGPPDARVVLVGEQPGDQEDRKGRPFVGPAGRELDRALETAGIDRGTTYVTNVVKHFKFEERGKRRIHQKPGRNEVKACAPWLELELEELAPEAVVLLGATAAQAVLGTSFRVSRERGRPVESPLAPYVTATIHPSAILRGDPEQRAADRAAFAADLANVAKALG